MQYRSFYDGEQGDHILFEKRISSWQRALPGALSLAALGIAPLLIATPASAFTASVLHNFNDFADGYSAPTRMVEMPDGTFYGSTMYGGSSGGGTIYKITPDGKYQTVADIGSATRPGVTPNGPLTLGPDGNLYGTTIVGGTSGSGGTAFKYVPGGAVTTLYNFEATVHDGERPYGGLTWVPSQNKFFGVANQGGASIFGTIFSLTLGGVETTIKSFSSSLGYPESTLCYNPADGMLYGTVDTVNGNDTGLIFKCSTTGALSLVKNLTTATGLSPLKNDVILGGDGNLYGSLNTGGANGFGTIYRIKNGVFSVIYNFTAYDGQNPNGSMVYGTDGALYGTTTKGGTNNFGTIFKLTLGASPKFTTIYNFTGSADGSTPGALLQAKNGLLYGGTKDGGELGEGSVFNCTTTGNLFTIQDLNNGYHDGDEPVGRPLLARDGNWYGVTEGGGRYNEGTIYRIAADGTYTLLYSFKAHDPAGTFPAGKLVQAADGSFLGTTYYGGSDGDYGAVFKMTLSGNPQTATVTPFYVFDNLNGSHPSLGLTLDSNGNYYGSAQTGGIGNDGLIFQLTPTGVITSIYYFTGPNGQGPANPPLEGPDGALYGVTSSGGNGNGVAFKITTNGANVWTTQFTSAQRYQSFQPLTLGADGNLYGTFTFGGTQNVGGIFQIIPSTGAATTAASFDNVSVSNTEAPLVLGLDNKLYGVDTANNVFRFDGKSVEHLGTIDESVAFDIFDGLVAGADGSFYGVSEFHGSGSAGTVFKLTFDNPAITGFTPTSAPVGATVSITGSNFTNVNSVTINGAAASFTVVDDSHINATVPTGTTPTGNITIATPLASASMGTFTVVPTITTFVVTVPATTTAGTTFNISVTARDQVGNINAGYNGTVHFTADDPRAVLPADTTLVNGVGSFPVTLTTARRTTMRARDTATSTITGTTFTDVAAGAVTHLTLVAPTTATVGTAFYVTAAARDQYENIVPAYNGMLHFTSSDPKAVLPAIGTVPTGTKRYTVKLKTTGDQTITATDTSNAGLTVTTGAITVN